MSLRGRSCSLSEAISNTAGRLLRQRTPRNDICSVEKERSGLQPDCFFITIIANGAVIISLIQSDMMVLMYKILPLPIFLFP